ncbi:ABC transporter substrate-binding protein [uncultured Mesonia sp.]|uniref:ABC transporter substrate-binding protein n=1 Tax=uncultured Mesonia sp. TaxID=399731 RepID=UPI00374ECC7A
MQVFDQLNRRLCLDKAPQRIISLVPSQTELLVDLGLADKLVGVTKFCVHPKKIRKQSAVVGGTKQVHLDKIAALNPDIILCNKEENTPEMVKELQKIAPVHVSDVNTLPEAFELMRQYGVLFNCDLAIEEMLAAINQKQQQLQQQVSKAPLQKVAYFIWKDPWMVAANHTFIHHILHLAGYQNVYAHKSRYPEINWEDLPQVDFIFLSSEPFPFKEKHIQEIPENLQDKVVLVDGEFFSWYGSRLLKAMSYFINLHKEICQINLS